MKVVFQGELGAYSELAALSFFPGAEISGLRTLVDVFEAVQNQEALVAVIPVENSSIGPITQCYDLLDEYDFEIFGELITPIRHCLVAHQQCHIEKRRGGIFPPRRTQPVPALSQSTGRLGDSGHAGYRRFGPAHQRKSNC